MHIFASFLFCLCLLKVSSGFYEEDSRKVVESINKQIIQGLNVATAERRPRNHARNFGAKMSKFEFYVKTKTLPGFHSHKAQPHLEAWSRSTRLSQKNVYHGPRIHSYFLE